MTGARAVRLALLFFLLAIPRLAPGESATAPQPELIAITGARVVDPRSPRRAPLADILLRGDRIVAVGPRIRIPADARRVHLPGRYLVPGLWDMHAHVALEAPDFSAFEDYVTHGVFGIRDMGGRPADILAMRTLAPTVDLAPFMYVAGPTLNGETTGAHQRLVRTPDEARAAVRESRAAGVDFIKIHRRLPRAAFPALIAAARAAGLRVAGHAPLEMSWVEAARGGMRSIEHVQTLLENDVARSPAGDQVALARAALARLEAGGADRIFRAMRASGACWTPTLIYYEQSWTWDPPERQAIKRELYARLRPQVARAARAGTCILAGTDLVEERGAGLLDELDRLVVAGLTPRQALTAATTNAFALVGRGPGPIVAGGEASFLICVGDPRDDLVHLRTAPEFVFRGRFI